MYCPHYGIGGCPHFRSFDCTQVYVNAFGTMRSVRIIVDVCISGVGGVPLYIHPQTHEGEFDSFLFVSRIFLIHISICQNVRAMHTLISLCMYIYIYIHRPMKVNLLDFLYMCQNVIVSLHKHCVNMLKLPVIST